MRAAFLGMDVVGEGEDGLLVAGVVLEGEVDGHIVHHAFGRDDGVDALLAGVEVAHELADAPLGVEDVGLAGALVDAFDVQALVEVGQLLEALLEGVVGELQHLEDLFVGLEAHRGAVAVGLADDRQLVLRHAAGIVLAVALAVAAHRDRQPLGQGVDAGHAHAVQAAGDLVAVVVELAAGVQFGHDHLHRGHAFLGMDVHGDAAAVVAHGDAVVGVQDDGDVGAEAGHGLVDGVVHHFVHQVVQAAHVGGTDVHGRALAHRGQPFENGNG